MNRVLVSRILATALLGGALASTACTAADGQTVAPATATPSSIDVGPMAAIEQPIVRFIRASGSLMAEEQADVAAETSGRVVATPVERGTPVSHGTALVQISSTETQAQVSEAEANAAQIEARLGLTADAAFDVHAVPEVRNARAADDLARSEFARIELLLGQRVVSQSEFDQRRMQMEVARQQYEAAKNGAAQQYQSLLAARARVALARKALADTLVRAPFGGVVAERLVSVGDYVTRGTKVAVVVRVNPLRVRLTIPEQFLSAVAVGQPVSFEVDAYPGRRFEGKVRYVSPALEATQRALTVEAMVLNASNELKPGLFATARLEHPTRTPGVLVPAAAVRTIAGTSRVFVVNGDQVEERIVTIGQAVEARVEIANGLKAGERVATQNVAQLADGVRVGSTRIEN